MKPKLAVSAILFLMASSLMQTGTAQQSEDLYQGTVTARQETDGNITYNLKENLSFENFQTNDGVYAGSVFFNQTTDPATAPNTSVMTFGGTGMSMSFENCSSVHSDRWTNDNEGGGAIRAEMLVFTDMGGSFLQRQQVHRECRHQRRWSRERARRCHLFQHGQHLLHQQ